MLIVISLKETKMQQMLQLRQMTSHLTLSLKATSTNYMEIWITVNEKRTLLVSTRQTIQFSYAQM